MKLQKRQNDLLNILFPLPMRTSKVTERMSHIGFDLSEDTIQRDIKTLTLNGFIESEGAGPSRQHTLTTLGRLQIERSSAAIDAYLQDGSRQPVRYLFDVPETLALYMHGSIFEDEQQAIISGYQQFLATLDSTLLARWRQKWLIEFAWK